MTCHDPRRSRFATLRNAFARVVVESCPLAAVGVFVFAMYCCRGEVLQPAADSDSRAAGDTVHAFAVSADESRMICRIVNERIEVRDVTTRRTIGTLRYEGLHPIAMSYARQSDAVLAVYRDFDSTCPCLVLWEKSAGEEGYRPDLLARDPRLLTCAVLPDGRRAKSVWSGMPPAANRSRGWPTSTAAS